MQQYSEKEWLVTLTDGRVKVYGGHTPMDARRKCQRVYGKGSVWRIEKR